MSTCSSVLSMLLIL